MKMLVYNTVGVLLAFGGLVWFLEGVGILQNSLITPDSPWAIIGLITLAAGSALLLYTNAELERN